MTKHIPGIHHVTAISGPPQTNVDFFTQVMGQRLVKKTVNFDDPGTYHLYYGDEAGHPGTILTFFPFVNAKPGRAGPGMAQAYSYAVSAGKFDELMARLFSDGIEYSEPTERFGGRVITLVDPDGAPVELAESDRTGGPQIDGFHAVTLWETDLAATARLMVDILGYSELGHEMSGGTERLRLAAPGSERGAVVDLLRSDGPSSAIPGAGTIHHVAFRARDDAEQLEWRERIASAGFGVTPVIDRQYFNAIYFREPGGVLFEIATDPPGFAVDEDAATMGSKLMLPAQHEPLREQLERVLPPLKVP